MKQTDLFMVPSAGSAEVYWRAIRLVIVCASGLLATSCVSSTLSTAKNESTPQITATQPLALSEEDATAQRLRSEGIEQIHAKADAYPIREEAPAYGLPRSGETELLTEAQIKAKSAEVTVNSQATRDQVPDAELASKRATMLALRRKGSTHYKAALKKIEAK